MRINRQGFRGTDVEIPKTRPRVMVYGDSSIAGEFSSLERTFPARLEVSLSGRLGRSIEVINAGIVGFGPDQVSRRLPGDLERYSPDLVLLAIFAQNDFGDLIRNKIYRLGPDGALVENSYRLADSLREEFHQGALSWLALAGLVRAGVRSLGRITSGGSAPEDDLAQAVQAIGPSAPDNRLERELTRAEVEFAACVKAADPEVTSIFIDRYDADISLEPSSESALYKRALMAQVLGLIQHQVARAGGELLLMIIPSAIDSCEGYDGLRVDRVAHPGYRPRALTDAVVEAARAQAIAFVDLFHLFQANDPCSLYFRTGDTHWNDRGEALAADHVARRINDVGGR